MPTRRYRGNVRRVSGVSMAAAYDSGDLMVVAAFIDGGRFDVKDVVQPVHNRTNKDQGINKQQD